MQQRTKTTATLDPEKDLKLEFDEKAILHGYPSTETQEGNTSESMEELDEEIQEVGDASMYEYSLEELDRKIEAAYQDKLAGRCIPWDEKFEEEMRQLIEVEKKKSQ